MERKAILLTTVLLFCTGGLTQAQALFEATEDDIGITAEVTYASRYIWRGFDSYMENHSAIQPEVNFDLFGTGWTFDVWVSRANGSGFEEYEEWQFALAYAGAPLWSDMSYSTNWQAGYRYYYFPDGPMRPMPGASTLNLDREEVFMNVSWPSISQTGIVPSFSVFYIWPAESDVRSNGTAWSAFRKSRGFGYVFGLDYDWTVPGLIEGIPEQIIHLSSDLYYNQGFGISPLPRMNHPDEDWSHVLLGATTDFDLGSGFSVSPGVWFQKSMDDSVNTSDEYYFTVRGQYKTR